MYVRNRRIGEFINIPRVWASPTKFSPFLLESVCPLQYYRCITSKWSPFVHLAPSYPHPRPDCATMSEKLSKRPSYFSHPN